MYICMFIQLLVQLFCEGKQRYGVPVPLLTVSHWTNAKKKQNLGKIDFIYCFYSDNSIAVHNDSTFFLFFNTKSRHISKFNAVKK